MSSVLSRLSRSAPAWSITQQQATLAVLSLLLAGDAVIFLFALLELPASSFIAAAAGVMLLVFAGLLLSYRRGWPYARQATVVVVTLGLAFGLEEPYLSQGDTSLLIAPLIALVLAGPAWVLASAAGLWGLLLLRTGGQGIYSSPVAIAIWIMLVGGLIVSRLIVETSLRAAQAARQEAEQHASQLSRAEAQYRLLFDSNPQPMWVYSLDTLKFLAVNEAALQNYGYSRAEFLNMTIKDIRPAEDVPRLLERVARVGEILEQPAPWRHRLRDGRLIDVDVRSHSLTFEGQHAVLVMAIDITEQLRAQAALAASERRFRALIENSADAIALLGADGTIQYGSPSTTQVLGYALDEFVGRSAFDLLHPADRPLVAERLSEALQHARTPVQAHAQVQHKNGAWRWVEGIFTNLLDDPVIGAIVANYRDFTERKEAQAQIERQLMRLEALRAIDTAITSSLDLRLTLAVFLEQVTLQLEVDAADVLLLDPHSHLLSLAASRGFHAGALQHTPAHLGEGYAGRVALERTLVLVPDLRAAGQRFRRASQLVTEAFVSYVGVPLIAKGVVKGVLELFHRHPLQPDPNWQSFLEALAGQAAIALDNASLFDGLQRSNTDLVLAYDTTLEGWSRALDLRDKESEGHSQRVTDMTLDLARAMGMTEAELVHVRRGALLHDMGKLGVPDAILLKEGPLTDEEWVVMRRHPTYAYEMLAPIAYLRPALDIPYCHHERWDGTGYPRQLKGEAIPLAARIFAVVDVWDALRSDRPYRPAWPAEKVADHVRALAGTHFDPRVVDVFLRLNKDNAP